MSTARVPVHRARNVVSTPAAAKKSTRLQRAGDEEETTGEVVVAWSYRANRWLHASPMKATAAIWRWRDYTAGLVLPALWTAGIGLVHVRDALPQGRIGTPLAAISTFATTLLPLWFSALVVAIGGGWLSWKTQHRDAARQRWLIKDGRQVRDQLRPRPTTIHIEKLPWRRSDHLRIPPGQYAGQYQEKASTLTATFGKPTTITNPRPGIIVVNQQLVDLLARPINWTEGSGDIPIGIDSNGMWITWNPLGMSLLVAGMKGSGKSALLKGVACNLVTQHPVSLIDLEGGPNFGRFRKLATQVALDPDTAIAMLEELDAAREKDLLALDGDDAPDAATVLGHVLIIDELSMLTHSKRPCSKLVIPILENMLARGRKPGFTVIAATQYPEVAVIPELLRGQFTHVVGLRTKRSLQTNVIFGDGTLGAGVDLSSINPAHIGRGYWDDGSAVIPFRSAGLYGDPLRSAIRKLTDRQQAAIDQAPILLTDRQQSPTADPRQKEGEGEREIKAGELRDFVAEVAQSAGRLGIRTPAVAEKLSVSPDRVRRACEFWRDRQLMRTDGTRWYWEQAA